MKDIELLAPAGDLEKLKIALLYGADAVYIGGVSFSLRARASNFDIDTIREACAFAHNINKKVYVTTNIIPHNEDMEDLMSYLKALEDANVDAIIAASPYIIDSALKHTNLEVHLSTQQSITNHEGIRFWTDKGVKRVVLARELTKKEIQYVCEHSDADVEVFIHGGMCVSYSGRCTLSNNMTDRDANRGGCAHSCRWNYDLYHNDQLVNEDTYFSMSSKDLQSVKHIPDLIDIGVDSLKIEGRMKSIHYIACVVKAYRDLIDEYIKYGHVDTTFYESEIKKAENRLTADGFLSGMTKPIHQLYNMRSERPTKEFVGIVKAYDEETRVACIEQRNYFLPNDVLEIMSPGIKNQKFIVKQIKDMEGNLLDAARHPKQLLQIIIPFSVKEYDIVRIIKEDC